MNNCFFNNKQNDSFHELKGIDLQELLVETENLLLDYRDRLNIPKSVQFGVEIEYEKVNKKAVDKYVEKNLIDWISKTDASLYSGGEVTSPIMHDCVKDWEDLQAMCQFLERKGADTSHRAGGHIHIDSHILENDVDAWRVFLKLYMNYEGVLFRFLYGDKINARPVLNRYALPFAKEIHDRLLELEDIGDAGELHFILSQNSKYYALYLGHVVYTSNLNYPKNTIEFRSPNSSTNEIIWQNNINTLVKMLLSAREQVISEEFLDYKTDHEYVSYNDNQLLYSAVNLKDVLEFVDMIFDNNVDKIYFLRQYLKGFQEYFNEGKRAIKARQFVRRRMKMKKYYLAYGSNLNIEDMKYRCPSARIVGTTYLNKARLVFMGDSDNCAYLTIEDDDELIVPLGVYEIEDDNDVKRLDVYEGYPLLYEKKTINIQLNGELVKGLIYVMRDNYNYHLPSTLYLRTCMKGYQDFEFNKDILIRALEDTKKEMAKDISKIKIK